MPLSCRFYLEEVLHSSPLSLDLCHGPRSHGLSSSRPLGPPFPRGWSSCPYPFHSSPVNCWLCLYSPDISLATQQSISWRCCYELQSTLPDQSGQAVIFLILPVPGLFFFFSSALPDALSNTYFLMMSIKLLWIAESSQSQFSFSESHQCPQHSCPYMFNILSEAFQDQKKKLSHTNQGKKLIYVRKNNWFHSVIRETLCSQSKDWFMQRHSPAGS